MVPRSARTDWLSAGAEGVALTSGDALGDALGVGTVSAADAGCTKLWKETRSAAGAESAAGALERP
jgi:hypothetical protein